MSVEYIRLLYQYSAWANALILDTTAELPHEQYIAGSGVSNGFDASIRDTLVHTLAAQELWLARFNGGSPTSLLKPEDFRTFSSLRSYWDEVEKHTQLVVKALEPDNVDRVIHYTNTKWQPFAYPLSQMMIHQVNHATQHRSEVALLLTQFGHSPGDLDFLDYVELARQSSIKSEKK